MDDLFQNQNPIEIRKFWRKIWCIIWGSKSNLDIIKILLLCILGKKNDIYMSISSDRNQFGISCASCYSFYEYFIYHVYRLQKKNDKQKFELLRNVQWNDCFGLLLHGHDIIRLGANLKIKIFSWIYAYFPGNILFSRQYFAHYLHQFQKFSINFWKIFQFSQTLFWLEK